MVAVCAITERRCIIMGNDLPASNADDHSKGDSTPRKRWGIEGQKLLNLLSLVLAVLVPLASAFIIFGRMEANIENLQQNITEIKENVESVREEVISAKEDVNLVRAELEDDTKDLWIHVSELEGKNSIPVELLAMMSSFQQRVMQDYGVLDQYSTSGIAVDTASYILYSPKDSEVKYTAEDVAQKKLLLPYKDNGRECFFYGQLDEKGNWDGDCIINIYRDKKLELVTEANYDGGVLKTFRQAFPGRLNGGRDIWYFSSRTMERGYTCGETWDYFSAGDYPQRFAYEDVTAGNIMDIGRLELEVCGLLEGYYNGNTSGGRFNDGSGEAYMVKYFEDGTVRTLYVGMFENGFPEDSTDHSWLIGRSDRDGVYSYYKGPFKGGHPSIRPDAPNAGHYWDIGVSQEKINQFLEGRTFDCDLAW